ncbi:hypothetical protein [Hyphomicrobium sp.]|uniref:hypothetical protein n=1 Tax=Hyphomicrobium sp. TaxID=82 RepID=UPI001DB4C650|nr:hypothetical protein [Hyphomicrobium sp.]MBY0561490.1 hypothetical protein [Hyphomicrobium sp.]
MLDEPTPCLLPSSTVHGLEWSKEANALERQELISDEDLAESFERLLRVAEKLHGTGPYADAGPIPHRKFDLSQWGTYRGRYEHPLLPVAQFIARLNDAETDCGTTACACGWAMTDPWFNERGLTIRTYDRNIVGVIAPGADLREPSWLTIAKFFHISDKRAEELFQPEAYDPNEATPTMVGNRILTFLMSARFDPVRKIALPPLAKPPS